MTYSLCKTRILATSPRPPSLLQYTSGRAANERTCPRARRAHTPPCTCAHNTAVVFVIQRGQSCGKRGECSAERHNGVSHSRHTHKLIAIDARRLLPPVPLVTLKGVASGTHGSQRQQTEHRLVAPHWRSSSVIIKC